MTYPETPLDVEVGLWVDGAWTDITEDVYVSDKIIITRGRADEGTRVDPGKCTLTLNNGASKVAAGVVGRYSPRNPRSDLYGKIGRNTPLRVLVRAGTPFLDLNGTFQSYATTPDAAALDITGDIDVRIDAVLTNWLDASDGLRTTALMGKIGAPTSNKSWFLGVRSNRIYFEWSVDGVNVIGVSSTVQPAITANGRLAVRATLDVDNGAGGRTVTFYTAPEGTAGPWTQLGDPVVQSGTTSISNSTAAVQVGSAPFTTTYPAGRVHAAEIRNGINGTVAASPDFTAQAVGASSFTDSTGRTWTMHSPAAISNRRARFIGEVSSWPARWDVSGKDVRVPIEAAGILRRLGQGAKALDSTLRRRIPLFGPLAYWPMEDGSAATQAYSPIGGVAPLRLTSAKWAAVDSLISSKPLPTINPSAARSDLFGSVPAPTGTLTAWSVRWVYRLDTPNTTTRTFLRVLSTGTITEWYIQQSSTGTTVLAKDSDGNTVFSQGIITGLELYGQWKEVDFQVTQVGGNIQWHLGWLDVDGQGLGIDYTVAGTIGRPTGVASPPGGYSSDLDGMAIGHITVWGEANNAAWSGAFSAWSGETSGARMSRLASEEGVPLSQWGDSTVQEQVGPQGMDTLLGLLEEAADIDGGILYERRNAITLAYRDRISLYNQPVALALDYAREGHVAPPLEPVDDDQQVRNDVTVTRDGGGSARAVLEDGPLSTQAPPDGVGMYDESTTLNLYSDDQAEPHAYWRLHLGTVDEARYPVINVNLAAAPDLIDQVTMLESGDRVQIANPPAWLPADTIDQLAQGYQETIGHPNDWDLQLNCTPASPWTVGKVSGENDPALTGAAPYRVDTDGTILDAGLDATATLVEVGVLDGPVWTNNLADYPFDWLVGGERMTVTAPGVLVNEAENPFFDTDVASWSAEGGTVSWSDAVVHPYPQAKGSLLITPAGGTNTFAGAVGDLTGAGSVTAGTDYIMSAWVYSPGGWSDVRPSIYWYTSGGAFVSTSAGSAMVVPAGEWTFLTVTYTAPATAAQARARVRHGASPTSSDVLYVWAARITAAAGAGATSLQTFTVVRSVNGVIKAQAAGAAVSLADPAIVAL